MIILLALLGTLFTLGLLIYLVALTGTDRGMIFEKYQTLTYKGAERQYRVRLPKNYDPKQEYPVVFAFHGYLDRSKQLEFYSGLSNLAKSEAFIAVYPEGIKRSWNGQICCGYAKEKNVDDVGFVSQLLTAVSDQYAVDGSKVYAVGFSNGGALVARLIQDLPDTFAGAAMVMSSIGTEDEILPLSDVQTPLILINGANDLYVPQEASSLTNSFSFIPITKSDEIIKQAYECSGDPEINETEKFIHKKFSCDSTRLESYLYKDTAHVWPGWRIMHPFDQVPDSTKIIWDFLNKED